MARIFVQQTPMGFAVVKEDPPGNFTTVNTYAEQNMAENEAYRLQQYAPNTGTGTGTGNRMVPEGLYMADIQKAIAEMQNQYLQDRLRMLDIPSMMMLDARERHRMAQEAAIAYSELSGWIPKGFEEKFIKAATEATNKTAAELGLAAPAVTTQEMQGIKAQLQAAGWQGGTDEQAIAAFRQISPPGSNPDLEAKLNPTSAASLATATGPIGGPTNPLVPDIPLVDPPLPPAVPPTAPPIGTPIGRPQPWGAMPGVPSGPIPRAPVPPGAGTLPSNPGTATAFGEPSGIIAPASFGEPAAAAGIATAAGGVQTAAFTPPTTPWVDPRGRQPTMAGANQLGNPRTLEQNLRLLGSGPVALPRFGQGQEPTLQARITMGDPSKIAQSLIMGGFSPEQAAAFLKSTPLVQGILRNAGGASVQGQGSPFGFVQGRQLDPKQAMQWLRTNDPRAQVLGGLASFSGQDPNAFFGSLTNYLPKGATAGFTRMI